MAVTRMDHVSVIVEDLAAAKAFFAALGLTLEGETPVAGEWVDRLNGIEGVSVEIAMMRTPDGHGGVELTRFRSPALVPLEPAVAPPNAAGLRQIMFEVDDLDAMLARLRPYGATLVGEIVQYGTRYKLAYVRGPADIIVALAEDLS